MKPQNGLLRVQRSTKVSPAAYNERRDGWCEGVHLLSTLTFINLKLPRGFPKTPHTLKLSVLKTMIPVACVGVHYKFGPCPQIFIRALAQFPGWAAWLNWQELPLCRTLTMAPPGPQAASEPSCSLQRGGLPSLALPPSDAHVAC